MRDYWIEYQRRRWMKPNAAVWMRPDAARWLLPNQKIWMGPKNWEAKYSPEQPRVPAGNSDGGQWTSEATAQADFGSVTDAFGHPYYEPGGHHEMVRSIYGKWDLKPETRRVFDNSTTGTVPRMLLRTSPEGVPQGHFWDGPGGAHSDYNEAIRELSNNFLERNDIRPEDMTPDQARSLLKEIRNSEDPRIRIYNDTIRMLRRLFRLRWGRE